MKTALANSRIKMFDIPHKGLRHLLAQLNLLAGSTDFKSSIQVMRLHELGRDLFQLLREHAADEEEFLLAALEQRQPGAALLNQEEHEIIEKQQATLEQLLDGLIERARRGEAVEALSERFYFEINRFQSAYLLHMLEEEEHTQQLLWKHFSDEELLEMRRNILGRMAPATQLKWYRYAAPYMSHSIRLQWLNGVKAVAPVPFFMQILETLSEALSPKEFAQLRVELGEFNLQRAF
ncbi:MAG: hemerythrin domain-containing protein [Saprospiraceae bacterium]|nr:hemerythrin domain-containing protein [Saprospiraceae bacterium]